VPKHSDLGFGIWDLGFCHIPNLESQINFPFCQTSSTVKLLAIGFQLSAIPKGEKLI